MPCAICFDMPPNWTSTWVKLEVVVLTICVFTGVKATAWDSAPLVGGPFQGDLRRSSRFRNYGCMPMSYDYEAWFHLMLLYVYEAWFHLTMLHNDCILTQFCWEILFQHSSMGMRVGTFLTWIIVYTFTQSTGLGNFVFAAVLAYI